MKWLSNYFDFSKSEQRGTILLLVLMLLLIFLKNFIPYCRDRQLSREEITTLKELNDQLAENGKKAVYQKADQQPSEDFHEARDEKTLFVFDPNTADENQLAALGFKEWQIKNIVRYRKSGRKFLQKEDLKKLYTVKQADYARFEHYISIGAVQKPTPAPAIPDHKSQPVALSVEINTADTAELKTLAGIGSFFAKKIVERREKLGGFVAKEQLLEIWNFDPEVLEKNKNRLILDVSKVRKMPLNRVNIDELKKHPYLSWKIANVIIKMREQKGRFTAIKEIHNSVLITDSIYSKIAPYFSLDD